MRRRLQRFLPVVLLALVVQILAPIGAAWATAFAVSDPLRGAEICHSLADATGGQTDQSGRHATDDGSCSLCCVLHAASAAVDTPQPAAAPVRYGSIKPVVWQERTSSCSSVHIDSGPQARAPPALS